MGKKQTRARSYVDVYLKETGLINTIGSKRWNEFLDDVYTSFKKSKVKMVKSKSEGDLCVVKDTEIEGKLVYNKKKDNEKVSNDMDKVSNDMDKVNNDMDVDKVSNDMDMDKVNEEKMNEEIELKENLNNHINNNHNTLPSPCIPDYNESYYNNGYLQSVGHPFVQLKHPPFENPHLFKPKIKREEIELRIQAVFGLLKLKRVKKNK